MSPAYYDSNYLLKLQIAEAGSTDVQAHAATNHHPTTRVL